MHDRTVNLTFHGIGRTERELDPGEADVWLTVAQLESALDAVIGRDDVRLTFDDGNASDVELALPALRERGLDATFFVVAGKLGEPGYLDADGVRALVAAGMTVGCHGMRHRPWARLGEEGLREELVEARDRVEDVIGRPVTEAACPFGSYDRRALRALRTCGYEHVYTSDRGPARPADWLQARNTVRRGDGAGEVERMLGIGRARRSPLRSAKLGLKRWR